MTGGVKVAVRVQHAPGRTAALSRLLSTLPPAVAEVIEDERGISNPWRGYKRCLADLPDCTHLVILQDDSVCCPNFVEACERIAVARPRDVIVLCVCGNARRTAADIRQAQLQRRRYVPLRYGASDHLPMVAVMWPVGQARAFLRWTEENPLRLGHHDPRSDDAVGGRWVRYTKAPAVATVPSLVEHPDDLASTIGKDRGGLDPRRKAVVWIGHENPLDIDWSLP